MKLVGDEVAYAEHCLAHSVIDKKNGKTLAILSKYFYHHEQKSIDEIHTLLTEFLANVNHNYNLDFLKGLIIKNANKKTRLNQVKEVIITDHEMKMIECENEKNIQKILFTMLVCYKIKNAVYKNNNNKINDTIVSIFQDAQIRCSKEKKLKIIAYLQQKKYITVPNGVIKGITLNYVDYDSTPAIVINRFDDFIFDLYVYQKKHVIQCKQCGKRVVVKGSTKPRLYCETCRREIQLKHQRDSMKKSRELSKK